MKLPRSSDASAWMEELERKLDATNAELRRVSGQLQGLVATMRSGCKASMNINDKAAEDLWLQGDAANARARRH